MILITNWDYLIDIIKTNSTVKFRAPRNFNGDNHLQFRGHINLLCIRTEYLANCLEYFENVEKIIFTSYIDFTEVNINVLKKINEMIFDYIKVKNVEYIKYIVKDTIEENIYNIFTK